MGPNEMLLEARSAGLRYVDAEEPGIRRVRRGRGFSYVDARGRAVKDEATLRRIRSLAIPPAWEDVWICPSPNGHMQARGRDARGRKQYRYHPLWQQVRDETKFERTLDFARALPALRRRVRRDLALRGMPRAKVIAAVVRLLEQTLLRVGNEEYAADNKSFGLTTLRSRHATVRGTEVRLSFRGKGGKEYSVGLRDRRLARVVRACQDLPGQKLFQYVDEDGKRRPIGSDDVNLYLREQMGDAFSAKDFRTWAGTVLAARALRDVEGDSVTEAVAAVAKQLGNTPTVCRNCYIHPRVLEAHLDGTLAGAAQRQASAVATRGGGLRQDERLVLSLLRRRVARARRRVSPGAAGARRARPPAKRRRSP